MITNITKIECRVGEKNYQLLCDIDAPLADVKEAIFQFQKFLGQVEDKLRETQQAQEAEKKAAETPEIIEEPVTEIKE